MILYPIAQGASYMQEERDYDLRREFCWNVRVPGCACKRPWRNSVHFNMAGNMAVVNLTKRRRRRRRTADVAQP